MNIPSLIHRDKNQVTARWIVLLIDVMLVLQNFFVAYLVRFNFTLHFGSFQFIEQIPLVAVVALLSFYLVGSYKGVIRHTGTRDAYVIFLASILLAVFLGLVVFLNRLFHVLDTFTIPISIISIHFLLNVIVLIASRYIYKYVYSFLTKDVSHTSKALIYGAGQSGLITYGAILNDKTIATNVVGFIDDNKHKTGKKYDRIPIIHSSKINESFIRDNNIKEIIVSIQEIATSDLFDIVSRISKLPVKVKIVPPVESWIDGTLHTDQIKKVKIEDLLGRNPIQIDNPVIQEEIDDKIVMVTGAAGSIGSELARQLSYYKFKKLILLDQAESPLYNLQQSFNRRGVARVEFIVADIRDRNRIAAIFNKNAIDIVYHAAAYKHVPLMEENPYEAIRVNVIGTKNVMDAAVDSQVQKFVMVSTDKAVNPTNVMGATKRVAELYASSFDAKYKTHFITTRFGNVLGSNGSVIPLFRKQIEAGGPLTVTHKEITRYFMTIPEACQLVLEAGSMGKGGEIFVFDMGESIKIYDLAVKMIQLSGFKFPSEMAIKIIGLRPGEKLYEELLNDSENTQPTHHKKIMIANVEKANKETLLPLLNQLEASEDAETIVGLLKKIVPEFISNNSKYSVLDK